MLYETTLPALLVCNVTKIQLGALVVPPHNAHYCGEYDDEMLHWRALCARDKAENIKSLLAAHGGSAVEQVLEVGCGTGAVLLEVRRSGIGAEHVGIDMADPSLHPHPGAVESGLNMLKYDGDHIPYADRSFDLVFASHVLEHVSDERAFLRELQRVAKKWVYVEVPCELHVRTTLKSLQSTLNIGHINAYSPETLVLTLSSAGLSPADIEIFDHSDEVHAYRVGRLKGRLRAILRRGLVRISPMLASRVFTYHVGVLIDATK